MVEKATTHVNITGDSTSAQLAFLRASTSAENYGKTMSSAAVKQAALAKTSIANAKATESLRMSYDQGYAGLKKYNAALSEIAAQVKLNNLSQGEASRLGLGAASMYLGAANAAEKYGNAAKVSRFHTANLGAQFNDIAVMIAAGQNPLMTAIQQGTQISQVWGSAGITLKTAGPAIAAAFGSMINPISLATIGIIAVGSALIQWGFSAASSKEDMTALTKLFKDMTEATKTAADELYRLQGGFDTLLAADANKQLVEYTATVDALWETLQEVQDAGGDTIGIAKRLEAAQDELVLYQKKLTLMQEEQDKLAAFVAFEGRRNAAYKAYASLRQQGLDLEATKEKNIGALRVYYASRIQGELLAQNAKLADAYGLYAKSRTEANKLAGEIGHARTNALALAGVDITSPISSAAMAASVLAANLGIALNASISLQNQRDAMGTYGAVGARGDPRKFADGKDTMGSAGIDALIAEMSPNKGGSKGGSGGGQKADKFATDLETLREALSTELEVELEHYNLQQETLKSALEQKLITQQEYGALMETSQKQHSDKMSALSVYQYGSTLDKTGQFLGDMASALSTGNDKMLRIGKVFAAAQGLINSYKAYTDVIADSSLPWYAKIPVALGVLGAGLGMVSAIKGVTAGGGTGGGGGGAASAAAAGGGAGGAGAAQGAPQAPLDVRLSGFGPEDMISGAMIGSLLDRLSTEAGDRGYRIMTV